MGASLDVLREVAGWLSVLNLENQGLDKKPTDISKALGIPLPALRS
jgi:hypothetical protein